jgi:hypothetical protein
MRNSLLLFKPNYRMHAKGAFFMVTFLKAIFFQIESLQREFSTFHTLVWDLCGAWSLLCFAAYEDLILTVDVGRELYKQRFPKIVVRNYKVSMHSFSVPYTRLRIQACC